MPLRTLFETLTLSTLQDWVDNQQEEHLHLDFKNASDSSMASTDAKKALAESLSGFANADGGLIVWGVDARSDRHGVDCARALKPTSDLALLLSRLNTLTGSAVNPTVDGVNHRGLPSHERSGFAVTLVPASDSGPHMAKLGVDRYFKRSGSQFLRMEHFDIEDMFGRRQRPALRIVASKARTHELRQRDERTVRVVIGIVNTGRALAAAPYLGLRIRPPFQLDRYGVDGNSNTGLPRLLTTEGSDMTFFGGDMTTIIHAGMRLDVTKATCVFRPESHAFEADYLVAADRFRICEGTIRVEADEL